MGKGPFAFAVEPDPVKGAGLMIAMLISHDILADPLTAFVDVVNLRGEVVLRLIFELA